MEKKKFMEVLYKAYAGNVSEMSAITQYFYQSIICDKDSRAKKTLMEISLQEMEHLKILAKIIKEEGYLPYFNSYDCTLPIPWRSSFLNYTTNFKEIILNDIKQEQAALKDYNLLITLTDNFQIKEKIQFIIEEELEHIQKLKSLLQ